MANLATKQTRAKKCGDYFRLEETKRDLRFNDAKGEEGELMDCVATVLKLQLCDGLECSRRMAYLLNVKNSDRLNRSLPFRSIAKIKFFVYPVPLFRENFVLNFTERSGVVKQFDSVDQLLIEC